MRRDLFAPVLALSLPVFAGLLPSATDAQATRTGTAGSAVPQQPGYATGHITCTDTQRPARAAQVRLLPVPRASPKANSPAHRVDTPEMAGQPEFGEGVSPVETDMEGNFTVRNLKPGRYYVRVDLAGYLSPMAMFSTQQLRNPDEETGERIAREVQVVDIHPQAETRVDISLQRGATLAGTVRYDDGSPASGTSVNLLQQDAQGKWEPTRLQAFAFGSTDGRGRFLFEALPPGTYAVEADLAIREYSSASMPMPTNGTPVFLTMSKSTFDLPVYSGSVLRKQQAVGIKVDGPTDNDGNDIALPLSKLHRISGALLARDGHALNSGKITLRYGDDLSVVTSVAVDRNDRQFHFPYVPEGSYTLTVDAARDVTEIEVPNAAGVTPSFHLEDKTVRQYGTVEQSLTVQNDMEGVLATVPDAPKIASAAPSSPEKQTSE